MTTIKSPAKSRGKKIILWSGGCLLALLAIGAIGYLRLFRSYPPKELMQDIKAGVAVREVKDPEQRFAKYLEHRYGPMTDAANRQKAFLDFFNLEHIRALQFMVAHSPKEQQLENIAASAKWVANYRSNLTQTERAALRTQLATGHGQFMLRKATAQYNAQDVYYRGQTAPVISQLLQTIHEVQGNQR